MNSVRNENYTKPQFLEIGSIRVGETKELVISRIAGSEDYAVAQRIEEPDREDPTKTVKIYLKGRITINGSKLKSFIDMLNEAYESDYLD